MVWKWNLLVRKILIITFPREFFCGKMVQVLQMQKES